MRYPGEANILKEQRTPRTLQASAPEEDEKIYQRSSSHFSDTELQRRMRRSTLNRVM